MLLLMIAAEAMQNSKIVVCLHLEMLPMIKGLNYKRDD